MEKTTTKSLFIASDHAGFQLKKHLLEQFSQLSWADLGTYNDDRVDYPDHANAVAEKVLENDSSVGVLVCGSGQGMAMRANKYPGIRAALCWTPEVAQLSREHNDANILCLGERLLEFELCEEILRVFLSTEFAGGRHLQRVKKIDPAVRSRS